MKQVIIVAPQFPPCNLTAGYRSRYFAMHLAKFGWKAKVLSVEPRFYEEKPDYELERLLPPDLEIIRTKAFPVKPIRLIGDIGIRAFWWHYRALCRLIKNEKIDLIYIPVPPNYSAMLGPLIYRRFGIPYAVDYIDPWINASARRGPLFTKAWLSYHLGRILEPIALRHASFITAVAPGYYQGAISRYRWLDKARCFAMPYGAEEEDFKYLETHPRPAYLFDNSDNSLNIVYAGAMLPGAYPLLEALLKGIFVFKEKYPSLAQRLKLYFIGTGSNSRNPESFAVRPVAKRYGLLDCVFEHPLRIPYLDALNHLKRAHAILILGSIEAHYTPSKIFQAVLSRRPVLALLHAESTGVDVLSQANAGITVTFDDHRLKEDRAEEIAKALDHVLTDKYTPERINWQIFQAYSAEAMTKKLAFVFDALNKEKG